jgi:hypothetical protein
MAVGSNEILAFLGRQPLRLEVYARIGVSTMISIG